MQPSTPPTRGGTEDAAKGTSEPERVNLRPCLSGGNPQPLATFVASDSFNPAIATLGGVVLGESSKVMLVAMCPFKGASTPSGPHFFLQSFEVPEGNLWDNEEVL